MKWTKYATPLALFIIGFVSRVALVEKFQSHWDGPLFSIAILEYNLQQHTPPEPGYPIYIALGKALNFFIGDSHLALLSLGIILSGVGAVAIYYFGKTLYGERVGIVSALILLSSPAFYFFGVSTYNYVGLPAIISFLALGIYNVYVRRQRDVVFVPIIYALSIGYRPQEFFFITPVFLIYILQFGIRDIAKIVSIVTVISLMWIIPVTISTGGVANYVFLLKIAGDGNFQQLMSILNRFGYEVLIMRILRGIYLALGLGLFVLVGYGIVRIIKSSKNILISRKLLFFTTLMLPAFLFTVIFRIESAGYQYLYVLPLIVFLSLVVVSISGKNKIFLLILIFLIVGFNLVTFFRDRDPEFQKPYTPSSSHYSEIIKNDFKWGKKYTYIIENFSPQDTVVIAGAPEIFNPAAFHLKEFFVFQFDALATNDKLYMDIWRFGYEYTLRKEVSSTKIFKVPHFAKHIVFIDDESRSWEITNKSLVEFGRNTFLSIVAVEPGQQFAYGYQKFKIK